MDLYVDLDLRLSLADIVVIE
uniref:Uncharacterized protein n=1 Tax=Anopheles quadriannulatus TaxID=34691 RepID=A0A182XR60_ANOQN